MWILSPPLWAQMLHLSRKTLHWGACHLAWTPPRDTLLLGSDTPWPPLHDPLLNALLTLLRLRDPAWALSPQTGSLSHYLHMDAYFVQSQSMALDRITQEAK